ncbi:MAG: insulinase family protein [Bacteroidales bacterium]|jgi:predicted Zn-dependent peptidase|nr:pitrilysin family protein [Bacteroidota bacterium]NLO00473.1 insulinase family protein [Bacteroidales bacterium]
MISGKAACGLQYAVKKSGSAVGYCALSIQCGTRDEGDFPSGIAHFTEHTLFKGTARRSARVINGYLDRLGGELNAYTTKEEIVLHATVLKEDLGKALGLLLQLATEPVFPEDEIQTEKGVVLDEIASYKDSPGDEIYDRFEEMIFAGHPLGRPILGTASSVRKITGENLRAFVRNRFTPDKMALSVVADIEETILEKKLLRLVENIFDGASGTASSIPSTTYSVPVVTPFSRRIEKRNHEVNAVLGNLAPSLYDGKDRMTAILLSNILGGPASNSMLNDLLRERNGWVYSVESAYTQYTDTGILAINFGCDRPNLEKCLKGIWTCIGKLQSRPLPESRLKAAKKQLFGQLAISSDNGETQCLSMGKSLLAFGKVIPEAESMAEISAITSADLQALACRLFDPETTSQLIFL